MHPRGALGRRKAGAAVPSTAAPAAAPWLGGANSVGVTPLTLYEQQGHPDAVWIELDGALSLRS
jgi:hypothetical protein